MKRKSIISIILAMAVLTGCSPKNEPKTTNSTEDGTDKTVVTSDETDATTTTETSDDVWVNEPQAYFVSKQSHDAGVVNDGVYFVSDIVFDEDRDGFISNIYEYVQFDDRTLEFLNNSYFLTIDDCCYGYGENGLEDGQTVNTYIQYGIYYGDSIIELNEDGWYLKMQEDGSYFIFDANDVPLLFSYEEQFDLNVAEDVVIYAYADAFSEEGIRTCDFTYKFDSFQTFKDRLEEASGYAINYNAHIVVEDGVVKEICIEPVVVNGDIIYAHTTECENGNIPDGDYCCGRYSFDEDMKGMTLDIRYYPYFTKEEIESLEKWDILVLPNSTDEYDFATGLNKDFSLLTVTNDPTGGSYFLFNGDWGLALQSNGKYYVDWNGLVYSAELENDVHLNASDSVLIMDNVYVFTEEGIVESENSITFNSMKSFADELESDDVYFIPDIHVVIENGKIAGIYINPDQHQPWEEH